MNSSPRSRLKGRLTLLLVAAGITVTGWAMSGNSLPSSAEAATTSTTTTTSTPNPSYRVRRLPVLPPPTSMPNARPTTTTS
jgi:hypothetical protein